MINIKDINGNIIFSTQINEGSLRKKTLMLEDYILLKFSVDNPIPFKRGSYTEIDGIRYEVVGLSYPTYNASTAGYDYELRMDVYYWKWKNKNLFYDRQNNSSESSWKLTRTPDAHLSVVCSNLSRLGYDYNGTPFDFALDDSVDRSVKLVEYSDINIIDALTLIAETWGAEWWVEDSFIHLGRCEYNTAIEFTLGGNIQSMSRSESNDNFATRIYAFGSDRNLPTNYRDNSGVVVQGVVQKRLMLPVGTLYIDAYPDMPQEQAVEAVVVFDDVYPRRIGKIASVEVSTGNIADENDKPTGKTYSIYTIKDAGLKNFKEEYLLNELRLVFSSGSLNGMDFELTLKLSDDTGTSFEIIRNEDYGQALPADPLIPKDGDEYILSGFDTSFVSDTYLPTAEQELKQRAEEYVEKSKEDPSVYDCTMNVVDMIMDDIDLNVGHRVQLLNPAYFAKSGRQSRIYGFEKYLDGLQVSYTVGNTARYSRLAQVENEIKEIVYQGNAYSGGGGGVYVIGQYDNTSPSDRNVFSALRSKKEIVSEIQSRALSRLYDDIASGYITFKSGFTSEGATLFNPHCSSDEQK